MTTTYDVMVLGGGIVGAATAYDLATSGLKTLLVDQFAPGHDKGSSHGDGRVVRFNYTEAIYVEMARLAYPAWEALSKKAGQALWQKTGLIEYGPANHPAIAESVAVLEQFDLSYERLTADAANERFLQIKFAPDTEIIYQADGAVAFADKAVKNLWRLAAAAGADTRTQTQVTAIVPDGDCITLKTADADFVGSKLVITAGGWAGQLLKTLDLNIPLEVTQEILAYFPITGDVDHRVGKMPVMIDYHDYFDSDAPFYALPQVDVPGVKAGWHHRGKAVQPDDPREIREDIMQGLRGWAERVFPHTSPQAIKTVTCLYTNTPDYHFILDEHPQQDNIIIGAGFSGHGFKFGPVLGQILSALVQGKPAPIALETFALKRFADPENLQKRVGA